MARSIRIGALIPRDGGGFDGGIRTLKFVQPFRVMPVPAEQKRGDKSPDFTVSAPSIDGKFCEIGAAWRKHKDGKDFISISLSDPDIPERFSSVAAFPGDGETFDVILSERDAHA